MVADLAESGASAVFFAPCAPFELLNFFNATKYNTRMSSEDVFYFGGDSWEVESDLIPTGSIALHFKVPNFTMTNKFEQLWATLPPDQYPDGDGDRRTLN